MRGVKLLSGLLVSACLAIVVTVSAQTPSPSVTPYTPPKTPWGDPDLQGIWPGPD